MSASSDLYQLAIDMDEFYWDFDTYDYWDTFDSREEGIETYYNSLLTGSIYEAYEDVRDKVELLEADDSVYFRRQIVLGKNILWKMEKYLG